MEIKRQAWVISRNTTAYCTALWQLLETVFKGAGHWTLLSVPDGVAVRGVTRAMPGR